jgi:hypothetical protein
MDWDDLMRARQAAVDAIDTDWILYVSADEIMHSYNAGETLSAAIARVDAAGFDVIDFNEFVFLPIETDYMPDREGPQLLRHYYFFEDRKPRLMRARKKRLQVSHVEHGGHVLSGEPIRLSPETFALRHYMFRNQTHAFEKYARRVYAPEELARGWHWHGFQHPVANFAFPPAGQLECLASPGDRDLSSAHRHKTPYWMWTAQAISFHSQIERLKARYDELQTELSQTIAGRYEAERYAREQEDHARALEASRDELQRHVRGLEADRSRWQRHARELEERAKVLQSNLVHAEQKLDVMLRSTSWRLTAPLRALIETVKRTLRT